MQIFNVHMKRRFCVSQLNMLKRHDYLFLQSLFMEQNQLKLIFTFSHNKSKHDVQNTTITSSCIMTSREIEHDFPMR